MPARFGVDDDDFTARLDVAVHQLVGLLHHEVGLERHADVGATGGDDVGAEGEVGHEAPVHHVPLDAVDAGGLEGGDPLAELWEVGGQHAGGDLDGAHLPTIRGRVWRDDVGPYPRPVPP